MAARYGGLLEAHATRAGLPFRRSGQASGRSASAATVEHNGSVSIARRPVIPIRCRVMTPGTDDGPSLTDEMALSMWAEIVSEIDNVMQRTQDDEDFGVEANSQLAADDADSTPYQVSHCARACLNAGVDHLHAAKILIIDSQNLHANAEYSLIRGALENFGTAFWILHPTEPATRVEHALRWMVNNYKGQEKALGDLGLPGFVRGDNVTSVLDVARRQAVCEASEVKKGFASTQLLQYADAHSTATDPYLMWQLCSGFAHGFQWAQFALNEMELTPTDVEGVSRARFTSDHKRLLPPAWAAFKLMNDVLDLFGQRARSLTQRGV